MAIRVLFVDDNEGLLRVGSDYIEMEASDFEVTTTPSATLALDLLATSTFDAIVSDYQMPIMDGLEFLQRVRTEYPDLPFIILTGRSREEIAIQALNLGATQYVTKGGDPRSQYTELVHIIRNSVELYRVRQSRTVTQKVELREMETIYKMITEKSSEVIFVLNMDMERTYLSPSVSNLRGYSYEESLKQSWEEVLTPDSLEKLIQIFGQGVAKLREGAKLDQPIQADLEMIHKDGRTFWAEVSATPIYEDETPIGIIGITRNIDDRKNAEQSLRESEERYKALYENLPDGMVTIDPTGVLTLCNDKVLDMFGYEREEVIGQRLNIFLHPNYQKPMMDAFQESMAVGRANPDGFEMVGVRKDESNFYFHLTSKVIVTNGVITGIQSHLRDISDKKKAEVQLRDQKEELSRFANFMAHDLRSSIHIIQGLASCLQEEHNPKYATDIIEASQKIESLLTKSVALADAGSVIGVKDFVNLSDLIKEAALNTLPINVKLVKGVIPNVRGDRDKLMQVFQNLLQNAVEHGQANQIDVSTTKDDYGLALRIRNDGVAVPMEYRDKIFTSDFTTKKGGGLGLSIVKRIIEAHGWEIFLDDKSPTTFKILIPNEDLT